MMNKNTSFKKCDSVVQSRVFISECGKRFGIHLNIVTCVGLMCVKHEESYSVMA